MASCRRRSGYCGGSCRGSRTRPPGEILLPELQGPGSRPIRTGANLEALAQEFPDFSYPIVDGLHLLGRSAADRLIAKAWAPALEVIGMDGVPAVRDGGNVLRPIHDGQIRPAPPPDVDAQAAAAAVVAACTTDEGAHITIDVEHPANGWASPPLSEEVEATVRRASEACFGAAPGSLGEGGTIPFLADLQRSFPDHRHRGHRRARSALQCPRAQRVPAHPHGQGRDLCGGRTAQVACPPMSWEFSTDPEFQTQLDWMDAFVREEVEPSTCSAGDQTFHPLDDNLRAIIDPLKDQVRARGLWACHLGPELGGQGYGQVKLSLMNEILGRSQWAPQIFGTQAPDTGNAEIIAHYGTEAQKERYLKPLLNGEIFSSYSMTEPQGGSDPSLFETTAAARRRRVGHQRLEVLLLERPHVVLPHCHGADRHRDRRVPRHVDVPGADGHAWR